MHSTICLESARDGNLREQRKLIEALRPRLTKMAAYYARRCGEDADDLLQEAWLGLLEALPELNVHIGNPQQYLIRCARWRLLDCIKRSRVRRCLPLDDAIAEMLPSAGAESVLSEACTSEFARELKSTQRAVLNCLLEGMTWREAGVMLGCTSANIAYYVRQIRKRYEEWEGSCR